MGRQAYQGQAKVLAERAPQAEGRTCRRWRTKLHKYPEIREANRIRSAFPRGAPLRHAEAALRLREGARYRGLRRNLHRLQVSFALVHLVTAQPLLAVSGR